MYKKEIRDKARRFFIEDDLTYKNIVRKTGVSLNNLKKWGADGRWKQSRDEYQRSLETLGSAIARAKLLVLGQLEKCFDGVAPLDSQTVYAAVKAGVFLLLLQADSGKGNPKAVLDVLEALNKNDKRLRRILKGSPRSPALDSEKGASKTG